MKSKRNKWGLNPSPILQVCNDAWTVETWNWYYDHLLKFIKFILFVIISYFDWCMKNTLPSPLKISHVFRYSKSEHKGSPTTTDDDAQLIISLTLITLIAWKISLHSRSSSISRAITFCRNVNERKDCLIRKLSSSLYFVAALKMSKSLMAIIGGTKV